jgi:hypothetical protein
MTIIVFVFVTTQLSILANGVIAVGIVDVTGGDNRQFIDDVSSKFYIVNNSSKLAIRSEKKRRN